MLKLLGSLAVNPATIIFVSANFVNAGNLLFNLLFSRWLGPELFSDLALLLTIKLSFLGLLNAVQMAVTEKVAHMGASEARNYQRLIGRINTTLIFCTFILLPFAFWLASSSPIVDALGLSSTNSLALLLLALPFMGPLVLSRGFIQGQMSLRPIVISANVEMLVRFVGGMLAWWLGLGIDGIAVVLAASILCGWVAAGHQINGRFNLSESITALKELKVLFLISLTWILLQFSQILMLDGDIVLAKMFMSSTEAGYMAALGLIQRVQFFACFALASILVPSIVKAIKNGDSIVSACLPIFFLLFITALASSLLLINVPDLVTGVMFGQAYAAINPEAWLAGLVATLFTFNYFLATLLMTIKIKTGVKVLFALSLVQITTFLFYFLLRDSLSIHELFMIKSLLQIICLILLLSITSKQFRDKKTLNGITDNE